MIDRNFYLENLTAFDELIGSDRTAAEKVIYKVYCILQRDKIWLYNVAAPEELTDEDEDLLIDVENELALLDETYNFRFQEFHELVMENMANEQDSWTLDEEDEFGYDEWELEDFDDEDDDDDDSEQKPYI